LYYQIFFGFLNNFGNFPKYFWPLLISVIIGIIVTFLLEKCRWEEREIAAVPILEESDESQLSEIKLLSEIRDLLKKRERANL